MLLLLQPLPWLLLLFFVVTTLRERPPKNSDNHDNIAEGRAEMPSRPEGVNRHGGNRTRSHAIDLTSVVGGVVCSPMIGAFRSPCDAHSVLIPSVLYCDTNSQSHLTQQQASAVTRPQSDAENSLEMVPFLPLNAAPEFLEHNSSQKRKTATGQAHA